MINVNDNFITKIYKNIKYDKILFTTNKSFIVMSEDNKFILKEYKKNKYNINYIKDELKILQNISKYNNKYISNILDNGSYNFNFFFIFSNNGIDLFEYTGKNVITNNIIYTILFDCLSGLSFLHSLNIAHCDIKLENLLICNNKIKICDFGYATYMDYNYKIYGKRGTSKYISKDLIKYNKCDGRLNDIWCVGILLSLLICDITPFENDNYNYNYKIKADYWNIYQECINNIKYIDDSIQNKYKYKYNIKNLLILLLTIDEKNRLNKLNEYSINKNLPNILLKNHLFFM